MAKQQTRRAVSLNREVYVAASKAALRDDKTLSQFVTDCLRQAGVEIPETHHVPVEIAERATTAIRHSIVKRDERQDRRKRSRVGRDCRRCRPMCARS